MSNFNKISFYCGLAAASLYGLFLVYIVADVLIVPAVSQLLSWRHLSFNLVSTLDWIGQPWLFLGLQLAETVLGLLAVIFGIIGIRKKEKRLLGVLGLVLGLMMSVYSGLIILFVIFFPAAS